MSMDGWYQLQFTIRRHGNLIRYQLVSYFTYIEALFHHLVQAYHLLRLLGRVLNAMERNGHILSS